MRARRTDDNQSALVATFRALGCSVWITSGLGQGAPDLVIAKGGRKGWMCCVEVKNPEMPPSKRVLTDDEQKWLDEWNGPYAIVEKPEQALQLVEDMMTALHSSAGCCGQCRCRSGAGG